MKVVDWIRSLLALKEKEADPPRVPRTMHSPDELCQKAGVHPWSECARRGGS